MLADIIDSGVVPTVRLTEIFRQAASSRIIVNAHRINKGDMPLKAEGTELSDFYFIPAETPEEIFSKLVQVVTQRIPKRFGLDPVKDLQILTPMNRGGLGARSLNVELQKILNEKSEPKVIRFGTTFSPGDKVLQTVNNYEKEVYNGDIGVIATIDMEEGLLQVDYDGRLVEYEFGELDEVQLAYATSIHKSQGSEYPAVVIPLAMQHYTLLQKNLVYAYERIDLCPYSGSVKPACGLCRTNCFTPDMHRRFSELMKYAGPRTMVRHPVLTMTHFRGAVRGMRGKE